MKKERELLLRQGCTVIQASDGLEGFQQFAASETGAIHFILMDIRMPNMDGLETTRAIRDLDRPDAKTVPIVAMSANAYEEDRQLSLAAGMNDHLPKPVDPAVLYQTIQKYLLHRK
ncbi:MAG: response regulator [Lachnospiraceae bacterium]|nr:response regulator [Lachnospiraceae bacterium]